MNKDPLRAITVSSEGIVDGTPEDASKTFIQLTESLTEDISHHITEVISSYDIPDNEKFSAKYSTCATLYFNATMHMMEACRDPKTILAVHDRLTEAIQEKCKEFKHGPT